MKTNARFFAPLQKIEKNDNGTLRVWGIASTDSVDEAGEVVTTGAMKAALPGFFKHGTGALREMHQPIAAGTVDDAHIDDEGDTLIVATVVDKAAIEKVLLGVYKGFSIGGRVRERDPKSRNIITKLDLGEISLVDRPCNPDAVLDIWKATDTKEISMKLEDLEKAEALALGKPDDAEALAKAAADAAVLAKAEADKAITEVVVVGELVNTEVDEVVKAVNTDVDDPVAKAAAALAELIAVVDAHTAPVVALNKFDTAMAALAALGDVGAPVVDLFKAAKVEADEAAAALAVEAVTKAADVAPDEALTKALATIAARDEAFAKMTDGMAALTKRMSTLELQPMPAKTAGPGAGSIVVVEKGADAGGSNAASAAAKVTLESDAVAKYLGSLSEDDRVHLIMKAAQATPINLGR